MDVERAVEIVTAEALKSSVRNHIGDGKELDKEEKDLLLSLLRVISYYSLRNDYDEYYAENKEAIDIALGSKNIPDNSFNVTFVEENVDGSANIEVELGSDIQKTLINEGVNFMLLRAALGCTINDVVTWATHGKELSQSSPSTETLDEEVKTLYA